MKMVAINHSYRNTEVKGDITYSLSTQVKSILSHN